MSPEQQWKEFVRLAQLRLESDNCPHIDDLIIIRQDVMYNCQKLKIAGLNYWNDILWSRNLGHDVVMKLAVKQIACEHAKEEEE